MNIKELLPQTNQNFFNLIKNLVNLDLKRSLKICTCLLNEMISCIYFPAFRDQYFKDHAGQENLALPEFLPNSERNSSIILFMNLAYKSDEEVSKKATDKKINDFILDLNTVNRFFIFNTIPSNLKFDEVDRIYKDSVVLQSMIPDLKFDPKFQEILKKNAFKVLYSDIQTERLREKYIKSGDNGDNLDSNKETNNSVHYQVPYQVDLNLMIASFVNQSLNLGSYYFGSFKVIDEVITTLRDYYIDKLPSKSHRITNSFKFFSELLKLARGRRIFVIQWNNLTQKLKTHFSPEVLKKLLQEFSFDKKYNEFPSNFQDFNPEKFISDYNRFLYACLYVHFGKIYSGVFLIWRAFLKYCESLQRYPEFYTKKGQIMENTCYNQAVSYGFQPEKIILTNIHREPSRRYSKMKEQVKMFPRDPLEFKIPFPDTYKSTFEEIDFAFRHRNSLFAFEIKGTSIRKGENLKIIPWLTNFFENITNLEKKMSILFENIRNGNIQHKFFKGINRVFLGVVRSEGVYGKYGGFSIESYNKHLKELREAIDNDSLESYLTEYIKTSVFLDKN